MDTVIIIAAIVVIGLVILLIGYIGNRIVDKGSDAIRNKQVRKHNQEHPGKSENLADRFK